MQTRLEDLRILLLQARDEAWIRQQEVTCFSERARVHPHQLIPVSVLRDSLSPDLLRNIDAVFIGGSGAYSVPLDYSWMPDALAFVRLVVDAGMPVFGSCWGHQLIARALGGTVIHDAARAELGCFDVELNDAGVADPLFARFPRHFRANQGHHDRVSQLPAGCISLAHSVTQPYQAFRVVGRPVYGTQFHSELDALRERERLIAYRHHYPEGGEDEAFQRMLGGLADTTEVDDLLYHFLLRFTLYPS